ncbi:hypothetical protein JCM6882_007193 [Rhodosporidiobolus microsporus]
MLPFGRPAAFYLTPSTPALITYEQGISPKHTLNVHDVDGEGREWTVQGSVAKVSIYNSKNLTLCLSGRIITSTVEVFNSSSLKLVVGPSSSSDEASPLGVLQLDPTLRDVMVRYTLSTAVGNVVVAPNLSTDADGRPSFGFSSITLQAGDDEPFSLFDAEGNLHDPASVDTPLSPSNPPSDLSRQLVVSREGQRWKLAGLARGEKDYPQLA